MDLGGGVGGGREGRIDISDLLQDIRVFLQERDGEGREEGGAGEGMSENRYTNPIIDVFQTVVLSLLVSTGNRVWAPFFLC